MVKVPFLDLPLQYRGIRSEVHRAMRGVLESQMFILGPAVEAFEKEVAAFCKVPHAVGVASGTDALLLSLMALGVKAGDRVATVAYTFFASAGAVSTLGARPLFVDIEPKTFNMDPDALADTLKKIRRKADRPKALMPVHLFGQMADMRAILEIARRHEIPVVEDAAQALGARMEMDPGPRDPSPGKERMAGALGDLGCFSFYPTKNLGAFGDGGMVITHDARLAEKVRLLRVHGAQRKYHHQVIGINSRLDALQAAVLQVKLRYLPRWSEARRRNAARYRMLFREMGLKPPTLVLPEEAGGRYHIYNQYVIRAKKRDALRECLAHEGIGSDIYYPLPLHLQECYRHLRYRAGDFPVSEQAARETVALPIYPELTLRQQRRVAEVTRDFYRS